MIWGIEAYLAGTWTAISDVMMRSAVSINRGIRGSGVLDRIASTGILSCTLNNAASNSGGTLGWYSPDHANARAGWDIGTRLRCYLTSGTTTRYVYHGRVSSIEPDFGLYRERGVSVQTADYMDIMANYKVNQIAFQSAKRPDEVIGTVVASLSIAPQATNYIADQETLTYALHTEQDEKSTAMNVAQKIAQSSLGYIYVSGDGTMGETLVYEPRFYRQAYLTSAGTFSDTMQGLSVKRDSAKIYNTIKDTVYPVSVGASLVVLASSPSVFSIPPSGTITKTFRYRDPNAGSNRVSGTGMVTPVADTDYRFSTTPTGSGNDANSSMTVSVTYGSNTASVTFTSTSTNTVYCNLFQMRGYMVSVYDPAEIVREDSASQLAYGEKTLTISQPYQNSTTYAEGVADWLLVKYKDPTSDISEIVLKSTPEFEPYIVSLDISSRITIVETVTGTSGDFFINQVSYRISEGGMVEAKYTLEPAETSVYWLLENATYGVLDTTTIPGY